MKGIALLFQAGTTPNAPTSPPPPPPPPASEPNAPTSLAVSSRTDTTVTFTYTDNSSDEDGFRIYASGTLAGTAAADATTITASSLTEGTEYDFICNAFNSSGESPDSNTVTAYTKLAKPTNVQGQQFTGFGRLTFTDNSAKEGEHVVLKNAVDFRTLAANVTQTDITDADAAGSNTWTVQARDSVIPSSDASDGFTATGGNWPS